MPIEEWNYKAQEDSIRHIGPMAEDFREAFNVGDFEGRITSTDADGVALAAIQGLNEKLEETQSELAEKQAEIDRLEAELTKQREEDELRDEQRNCRQIPYRRGGSDLCPHQGHYRRMESDGSFDEVTVLTRVTFNTASLTRGALFFCAFPAFCLMLPSSSVSPRIVSV